MIRDRDGEVIGIGTRYRDNVFKLNPTEMTCLVAKLDDSLLWHKRSYHMNFISIVKTSRIFSIRDFLKILNPTNTIFKECVLEKT